MKTYRVGIIGYGMIGKVHAFGYRTLPFYYDPVPLAARITHVCTGHENTAKKARSELGAETGTTDWREITENPEIDIVHICSPNDAHCEQLLSAMTHGKHIYCDKPLVATAAEADRIEAALVKYQAVAQMTFNNRFSPAILHARQLIEEGFLGRVLEFRAAYLHAGSADPDAPLKWKLSATHGGGVIADLGAHAIDLVDWLLGEFDVVAAMSQIAYPDRPDISNPSRRVRVEAEDGFTALLRTPEGARGVIEGTKLATGSEDELRLEIHGNRGAIRFNAMAPHFLEIYDAKAESAPIGGRRGWTRVDCGQRYPAPARSFPGPKFSIGWLRGHVACLAAFLQAVAESLPAQPDLTQGIKVQRYMETIRRLCGEAGT